MKNFTVKDHSVSKENFELQFNSEHNMWVTTPQPSASDLPKYYQSEEYISHTDTQRNLFEKVYHGVRSYSLQKKIRLIDKQTPIGKLLDIGCGTGDFLEVAKKHGWEITGIEPNKDARDIAAKKTNSLIYDTVALNDFEANSFDVITLWHVLEHLPNLEMHVKLFNHLLKPNGLLIIAVPNYNSFDSKHYKEFWAAYDVPRHLWHFSQNSIKSLFGKENLKVVKTSPMKFDSYYVSLLSEKIKTGKMNPIKAFYIGFQSNFKAIVTSEYSSLVYSLKKR